MLLEIMNNVCISLRSGPRLSFASLELYGRHRQRISRYLAILIGKSFPFWLTGTISFREEECSETVASTAANSMATLRTGRVLVLGCDSRSGLTVVRSLGRAGLAGDIGWAGGGSLAGTSRYVRAVRDTPAYVPADRSVEPAWKRSLIDLVEDQ